MSRKPLSPVGAIHPALFCVGMYIIALFFSVFICSSIFYAINEPEEQSFSRETRHQAAGATATVANASTAVIASAMK